MEFTLIFFFCISAYFYISGTNVRLMTGYLNVIYGTSVEGIVSVSNTIFFYIFMYVDASQIHAETFQGHYRGKFSWSE